MARARNIKPGFFTNEELADCTISARLCFIGLWTLADREGRLEDRPKRIKAELFPYDAVDVDALLAELQQHAFLVRYRADGTAYLQIVNFVKHQRPHHMEVPSEIPAPPAAPSKSKGAADHAVIETSSTRQQVEIESSTDRDHDDIEPSTTSGRVDQCACRSTDSLIPDSLIPDSFPSPIGEGCDLAQSAIPPPPTGPPAFDGENANALNGKSVVQLAATFTLPDQWGLDAEALGFKPDEVMREAERFRQYWVVGKGQGKRRTVRGWRQSWSTWLGKAGERR